MTGRRPPTRRFVIAAVGALLVLRADNARSGHGDRIAYLAAASRASVSPLFEALREGLRACGYADGDITIDTRYADGHAERLPDLAAELVGLAPRVIVTGSAAAVRALRQATGTIPIVMAGPTDPVGAGFVRSLAHPGGNVTGLSSAFSQDIAGKQLQLLQTIAAGATRIGLLLNPANPGHAAVRQVVQQAAGSLHVELVPKDAHLPDEIDEAFAAMIHARAHALLVPGDPMFLAEKSRIIALAAHRKLPAIYQFRDVVTAGGLMSFGPELSDLFRRAAVYIDKILKGANPADLPIEQPTKFRLVVNMKTAQALGLTLPPLILAGADEVIE